MAVLTVVCKPPQQGTGRPPLVLIVSAAQRQSAEVLRKAKVLYRALLGEHSGYGRWKPRRLRKEVEYFESLVGRGLVAGDDGAGELGAGNEAVSDRELSLELASGARIVCLPAKAATSVGFTTDLLIYDEASHVPEPVYYLMRATRARTGGKLCLLSSPFGKRGFFWEAYHACEEARDLGKPEPWHTTRVTAYDEPRRLSDEFLDRELEDIGEHWFDQEYRCAFRDPVDQVIPTEQISRAVDPAVEMLFK
jgi:hypothetical protein